MNQVLGFEGYLVFLVTFSPFGEGQFFEGDEVFGVEFLGHAGSLNGESAARKSRRR